MSRRSFLPRIPEFDEAANLLDKAVDAYISGDNALCAKLIVDADFLSLHQFSYLISGKINPEIHRQSELPKFIPVAQTGSSRMPNARETRDVYLRDGYRCRFCDARVIVKEAKKILEKEFPLEARNGKSNKDCHFGLSVLTASIDHILPFKRGGTNDLSNLVTACGPCQFGRNQWTLEEVEIEDPRNYPPIIDSWDGLTRLLKFKKTSP